MFLKLGIIGIILISGGIIFSSEITGLFPNTSTSVAESLKDDVNNISNKASESIENKIESSFDKIIDNTNQKINDGIDNAKDSSTNFVSNELSKINPLETIENTFKNNSIKKFTDNNER